MAFLNAPRSLFFALSICSLLRLMNFQNTSSSATWWVTVNQHFNGIITCRSAFSKVTVMLSNSTDQFLHWSVTGGACQFTNASAITTVVMCVLPGVYELTPIFVNTSDTVDHSRHLVFGYSPYCYQWYITQTTKLLSVPATVSNNWNTYDFIRVWITANPGRYLEGNMLVDEDVGGTAVQPSKESARISMEFYLHGQIPLIVLETSIVFDHQQPNFLGFVENSSFWEFRVATTTIGQQYQYHITGDSMAVGNCFIRDTDTYINVGKWGFDLSSPTDTPRTFHGSASLGQMVDIIRHPCEISTLVLLANGKFLFTQTGFKTSRTFERYIPQNVLLMKDGIIDATVLERYMYTLHESGDVLISLVYSSSSSSANLTKGDKGTLRGLTAKAWCNLPELTTYPAIAAYSSDTLYTLNYKLENPQKLQVPLSILQTLHWDTAGLQVTIFRAAFHSVYDLLGVLLTAGTQAAMVLHDFHTEAWSVMNTFSRLSGQENWRIKFGVGARLGWVVYHETAVYIMQANFTDTGFTSRTREVLFNGNNLFSKTVQLKQLELSIDRVLILSTINELYFSHLSVDETDKLETGLSPTSPGFIWLNEYTFRVYIIDPSVPSNTTGAVLTYPLNVEIKSFKLKQAGRGNYPKRLCPYNEIQVSDFGRLVFLDINEEIQFWASLVTEGNSTTAIQAYASTPTDYLNITTKSQTYQGPWYKVVNMTLDIVHPAINFSNISYVDRVQQTETVLGYEIAPSASSLACPPVLKMSAHIKVGCPPNRKLVLARPAVDDPTYCAKYNKKTNYQINIPKKELDGSYTDASKDKNVAYLVTEYGCPLRVRNVDDFMPMFAIYDNQYQFVSNLTDDFYIYEVNFRTGWSFNTTMFQAGCKRRAQKFTDFLNSSNKADIGWSEQVKKWGPYNYESCFNAPESNAPEDNSWHSEVYQILNPNKQNAMSLPLDTDGIFVFAVKVLERNVSYCNLSAVFAIDVYGAIPDANVVILGSALGIFASITLIALIASYINLQRRLYKEGENFKFEDEASDDD